MWFAVLYPLIVLFQPIFLFFVLQRESVCIHECAQNIYPNVTPALTLHQIHPEIETTIIFYLFFLCAPKTVSVTCCVSSASS